MADSASERCSSPDAGMELAAAARFLRNGGVLVFPTETFYGLGCLAANAEAVARVYQLKQRPVHKPDVRGWLGCWLRAQSKLFFSKGSTRSALFFGSKRS